ncbi:unnamed protein product [Prunus armeniaca]|uniref:Uncharacterized protein n=1 Tax=Prunus armeniaca TaxID=36596 RepID=A0A6J5X4K3_PRUAR|nr:unnamed protein product [Prunus armeniaca]
MCRCRDKCLALQVQAKSNTRTLSEAALPHFSMAFAQCHVYKVRGPCKGLTLGTSYDLIATPNKYNTCHIVIGSGVTP